MFDVTERKQLEDRLAHDAAHDPLTGLPNRTLLLETLDRALRRASRTHTYVAVLFLDLDRFKLVNDAARPRRRRRPARRVRPAAAGRAAGVGPRRPDRRRRVRRGLHRHGVPGRRRAARPPHRADARHARSTLHGREVFVTASIGIAVAEESLAPATSCVRCADTAAYRAKERGRNCYEVFDDELRAATATALETETALHRALAEDQLLLHYQPIVDLDDGRTVGLEGLLRWQHPQPGAASARTSSSPPPRRPALIVPIGMPRRRDGVPHARDPRPRLTLAVNLSPRELAQPDLVDRICRTLRRRAAPTRPACASRSPRARCSRTRTAPSPRSAS